MASLRFIFCAVLILFTARSPSSSQEGPVVRALQPFEYTALRMGVQTRLVLYATREAQAARAARQAFDEIARLEEIFSDYQTESELMRLCRDGAGCSIKVSPELCDILRRSLALAELTGGAFDVTAGPAIRLWRQARVTGRPPEDTDIVKALAAGGWRKVSITGQCQVRLAVRGMRLDLGGIAKGYACDAAIRVLRSHGVRSALVEMGGDIAVSGPPPGRAGWDIRVANLPGGPGRLQLAFRGVSTSGDTEQYAMIDGRRFSHIVDPRTGMALTSRRSVTVVASDAVTSDALSTALSVVDKREVERVLRAYPGAKAWVRTLDGP